MASNLVEMASDLVSRRKYTNYIIVEIHACPSDSFHCWCRRRLEHLAPCETVCERSLPLCLGVVEPPLFNSGSGAVDPRAIALPCVWTSLELHRLLRGRGLCFGLLASTTWCWAVCPTWLWTTSTSWSGLRLNYNVDDLDTDFPGGVKPLPSEG